MKSCHNFTIYKYLRHTHLLLLSAVLFGHCSGVKVKVKGDSTNLTLIIPETIKVGDKILLEVSFSSSSGSSNLTNANIPDKVELKSGEKFAKISLESGKYYLDVLEWSDQITLVAKHKGNSTKKTKLKIDPGIKSLSITSNMNPVPINWSAKLTVNAVTENGENKDVTDQVNITYDSTALWLQSGELIKNKYTPSTAKEAKIVATMNGVTSNILTVDAQGISSFALEGSSSTVNTSAPLQLQAKVNTENGASQYLTDGTWISSNPAVASVSSGGIVTAVSPGSTTISFTPANGPTVTYSVTVPPTATLTSISISPSAPTITYGQTQQFTATGTYSDSSTTDLTSAVSWSSSDSSKASVSALGLATSTGIGSSTITASLNSISSNVASLTVSAQASPSDPTIQSATASSSTSISVNFTSGGGTTTNFVVAYQAGSTLPNALCTNGSLATGLGSPILLTSLSPNTQYSIRLCALNSNPTPDKSAGVTAQVSTPSNGTLANPTFSPAAGSFGATQSVTISGPSGSSIEYSTDGTNFSAYSSAVSVSSTTTLTARAIQSGWTNSSNVSATYTINGAASTPTFSIAAGTYNSTQSVSLSTSTAGATIRYTTDGSTPNCASSSTYSSALSIHQSQTVNAIACKSDYLDSSVASAAYVLKVSDVSFSVSSGHFQSGQTLSLSTTTAGATIYYTRNGSAPTTASSVYAGPLTITSTEDINAFAAVTGWTNSDQTNVTMAIVGVTVTPTSGLTTSESGSTASFTVVLTVQPTADVTMSLTSSDLTEGTVSPASLTFTSANWNSPQTVTLTGVNDSSVDGNQPYTIQTGAISSADTGYNGLNPDDVNAVNNDDDVAGISLSATSGLVTTEAGGTTSFTIALNTQPTSNVTIGLSSSDTSEGTALLRQRWVQ